MNNVQWLRVSNLQRGAIVIVHSLLLRGGHGYFRHRSAKIRRTVGVPGEGLNVRGAFVAAAVGAGGVGVINHPVLAFAVHEKATVAGSKHPVFR